MNTMLTGESDGKFDILRIRDTNGTMVNILTLISAGGGLTNAQVAALIAASLVSYTNTTGLNVLLNTKADLTYLATILATYTNTTNLTTLLATKQAIITGTTNLTCQDLSVRNLTSSASVFYLRGGAITYLQDNLANTIIELHNSHVAIHRSVNFNDTVNFYTTIALTNSTLGLTGTLFVGPGNKLR